MQTAQDRGGKSFRKVLCKTWVIDFWDQRDRRTDPNCGIGTTSGKLLHLITVQRCEQGNVRHQESCPM
jgi:hypothetical protein